jgi:hypothetical protein
MYRSVEEEISAKPHANLNDNFVCRESREARESRHGTPVSCMNHLYWESGSVQRGDGRQVHDSEKPRTFCYARRPHVNSVEQLRADGLSVCHICSSTKQRAAGLVSQICPGDIEGLIN